MIYEQARQTSFGIERDCISIGKIDIGTVQILSPVDGGCLVGCVVVSKCPRLDQWKKREYVEQEVHSQPDGVDENGEDCQDQPWGLWGLE